MNSKDLNEILPKNFLSRKARDRRRLVIPLVHKPVCIDAEDGRVRRVDERLQLLRDSRLLDLDLLALRDVLADTEHAHHVATNIPSRSSIQEHVDTALVLGVEGELEVGGFSPLESVVEHLLDADLILFSYEVLKAETYITQIQSP